jgi:hypothetical protein
MLQCYSYRDRDGDFYVPDRQRKSHPQVPSASALNVNLTPFEILRCPYFSHLAFWALRLGY